MKIIKHRVNTFEDLKHLGFCDGAEIDVRYHHDKLILEHDPFSHQSASLVLFEEYLKEWNQEKLLIINVKTEGIEEECLRLLNKYAVSSWFFLDQNIPSLVKYSNMAMKKKIITPLNLSVRYSVYEPIDLALKFSGRVGWVWLDCFDGVFYDGDDLALLKKQGFKVCIVSPELQGRDENEITILKEKYNDLVIDAVCTKYPGLWKN